MTTTAARLQSEYRKLRNQLLEAEMALKDQRESVAALRRRLPMGPAVATDYVFREGPADILDEAPGQFKDVRLSDLFAPGKDRLIVDHMMWGATDISACPMCADGYNAVEASLHPGPNGNPNHRGLDLFSPVWNLFDLLPGGREDWSPKLFY
jgi:predicted dithiol-disulfide oxidoreductase (DUF899 family)